MVDSKFGDATSGQELVVLVHGLGGWTALMKPLARSLQSEGFATHCWGYTSTRRSISGSAALLQHFLAGKLAASQQPVHLLTHSMGGILARIVVSSLPLSGRLLMLAPPHRGSPVARRLSRIAGGICKPLTELSDTPGSFVNRLPPTPPELETGVIAASRDFVIPQGNTHLGESTKYTTVRAGHTSMLFRSQVATQCAQFLKHGEFHAAVRP